ncbi:type II toxin-antitoxin system Phd/YefM family antitoxin [Actinoplanes sp. LDG1-06]|uniref:Antitoxin n=1 Tax=Paractinoplanes ovalisporus TaxID=2810368 RepID=A0ABS2AVG2_9ACTN|nr:type II toxin-antitoxin system Phd/YefM family antitoxin [Actinoplanes ovalisporus]MBM2623862.1 type II toxin-antitoxin system Phd/YefM family antitoxin [Actinoplanes ovalisporus]
MTVLPLAEARNRLSALIDDVVRTHDALTITRNGVPAAVVLAADDYESIMETLSLISDPIALARIAESESAAASGDVTTLEEMEAIMARRFGRSAA